MLFYTSTFEPIGDPVKGRGEKWGRVFSFCPGRYYAVGLWENGETQRGVKGT